MRIGTILQRVPVSFLREGDRFYLNLSSARPVRYSLLWVGQSFIEGVTKGGQVRRFRVSEVWYEVDNGEGWSERQEKIWGILET
jgi:hypothetical protein